MRRAAIVGMAVAGMLVPAGPTRAADLAEADLTALIRGKTVYLQTAAASVTGTTGQGAIHYSQNGDAFYKTPSGDVLHGTWKVNGSTLCHAFRERPNTPCSRWDKTGDVIQAFDAVSGKLRATVIRTAPGNPEKLAN